MKKILFITLITLLLITGCKSKEELDKEFDDKVFNTLIEYSSKIYDNKQYINYQIIDNQYYISLRNIEKLGYDIKDFVRPSSKKQCNLDQTGITITLISDTYNTSYSILCE